MKLALLLKNSIASVFDVYRDYGKKLYPFSFGYTIAMLLISAALAVMVCLAGDYFHNENYHYGTPYFDRLFFTPGNYNRWMELTSAYCAFFLALYAIYLKKIMAGETISSAHFLKCIQPFLSPLLFIIIIYSMVFVLIYNDFFSVRFYDTYNNSYSYSLWRQWLNSFGDLIRMILPFFGVWYIVINNYSGTDTKYKTAMVAMFILFIVINASSAKFIWLLNKYILSPLGILFQDSYIPLVFIITALLFFTSWFILGLAASIHFPMRFSSDETDENQPLKPDPGVIDQPEEN